MNYYDSLWKNSVCKLKYVNCLNIPDDNHRQIFIWKFLLHLCLPMAMRQKLPWAEFFYIDKLSGNL